MVYQDGPERFIFIPLFSAEHSIFIIIQIGRLLIELKIAINRYFCSMQRRKQITSPLSNWIWNSIYRRTVVK